MATQLEKDTEAVYTLFHHDSETWIKGSFHNGYGGHCLIGGVRKVMGENDHTGCEHEDSYSRMGECIVNRERALEAVLAREIIDNFRPNAENDDREDIIVIFNDHFDTTFEQVEVVMFNAMCKAKQ